MSATFGIIQVAHVPVRATDNDTAEMVTQLLFGETVEILEQKKQWIKIRAQHDQYEGWMDHKQVVFCDLKAVQYWHKIAQFKLADAHFDFHCEDGLTTLYKGSILPGDFMQSFRLGNLTYIPKSQPGTLDRNQSIIEIAQSYLNAPYLWGGRSITGIDCSGLTQQVYAFLGKQIPRDASQQVHLGKTVAFAQIQAGDLAFFKNTQGKIIHVGILTGQGTIIHAHGKVTEDFIQTDGIYKKHDMSKSHELEVIKRL